MSEFESESLYEAMIKSLHQSLEHAKRFPNSKEAKRLESVNSFIQELKGAEKCQSCDEPCGNDWCYTKTDPEEDRFNRLTGLRKHYCPEWDYMAIDETSPEFDCCLCTFEPQDAEDEKND